MNCEEASRIIGALESIARSLVTIADGRQAPQLGGEYVTKALDEALETKVSQALKSHRDEA